MSTRPSAAQRLRDIGVGMEWDAKAKRGRERVENYGGSKEQGRHRRGENLPTAKNGSRAKKR